MGFKRLCLTLPVPLLGGHQRPSVWLLHLLLFHLTITLDLVRLVSLSTQGSVTSFLVAAKDVKSVPEILDLQCPPCDRIHCGKPRNHRKLNCKGGTTTSICNCCPVCAKTLGEECGGTANWKGKCDRGLYCKPEGADPGGGGDGGDLRSLHNSVAVRDPSYTPRGTCHVDSLPVPYGGQRDQAAEERLCKPRCTPTYCTRNPRRICSAVDNAETSKPCQGPCHHTSCRACRYVRTEPHCPKCAQDDFHCLKKFGSCIRKQTCSKKKHPCRRNVMEVGAKFQCLVPECRAP